jgi:hypothetical protein
MLWVTRSHVHVDRVACPWLLRRFVDSGAEFLFVAAKEVEGVAARTGAIPFDVPGAELGHHGDGCSFDAILAKYGLKDRALLRLAKIVNAAGLEAIASGFGLRFPDDPENVERQFEVYDALYAWCRVEIARSSRD